METLKLPVLALRGTVLFPGQAIPIGVGRSYSLRAIEEALSGDGDSLVFAVAQRDEAEDATPENLYSMGVIARVGDVERSIQGLRVMLEVVDRATAVNIAHKRGKIVATVTKAFDAPIRDPKDAAFAALYKETRERAFELGEKRGVSPEVLHQFLDNVTDPGRFTDLVAGYLQVSIHDRQKLLETLAVEDRLRNVLLTVQRELEVARAQEKIQQNVKEELGGKQREAYLREQMKAIQKELGEEDTAGETDELRKKLEGLDLPKAARKEVDRELKRLGRTANESMEAQVIRNYLEWIAELPWNERSDDSLELKEAIRVLDEDHYGLRDVKDRVLEFLAIRQMRIAAGETEEAGKAPILLFVGPPGVGKTSIAKSVARSLGREYVRIALGGVRDEADVRGHRRTYVGAMPGRIIQGLKTAGTKNPVFVLDEVDKLGASFQGDPASALLEVLDPAQNDTFTDHYLNVPFDLSEVLFIATANFIQNIPAPLLDRMEVVDFSGYTEREKVAIAKKYLLPRKLKESGLLEHEMEFGDEALNTIVSQYTRESGVRQLERKIGMVLRKIARKIAAGDELETQLTPDVVRDLLGRPKVRPEKLMPQSEVGVATGMYYTPAGGDIMFVETNIRRLESPDTISLILTGQLGDVMKESARAALSYAAANAAELDIPEDKLGAIEAHIHVPAGAIPKDGPSAGVTMATALVSSLSGRPVRREIAMTGEVTLRGRVLPIGGVKEKVLGALRAGITHVILPRENEADLDDVPEEARETLRFSFVEELHEVLDLALAPASSSDTKSQVAQRQTMV